MDAVVSAPDCMRAALENYRWTRATDGESGANVYLLDQADGPDLYLKCGAGTVADDIVAEFARLHWLGRFLPVPQIHQFFYGADRAWLLTTAMPARSAQDCLESDPSGRPQIVRALAEFLRELHSLPLDECPFNSDHQLRMTHARRNLDSGKVDESDFDPDHARWSAENVWTAMQSLLPMSFDRVVTHGDFSLGNVFLESGRVTGCIDVGRAGAADPYQDLAILGRNLKEFEGDLQSSLFEGYGILEPDMRKIEFHLCLDEFF